MVSDGDLIYGDTIHSLIERRNYQGTFLPGFQNRTPRYQARQTGLLHVDHCVGNVELGKMNFWVGFYERVPAGACTLGGGAAVCCAAMTAMVVERAIPPANIKMLIRRIPLIR